MYVLSQYKTVRDRYLASCTRTWANMAMASSIFWDDVQHNGSQWVAVGDDASYGATENINYSANGVNWSAATGDSYILKRMQRVCHNGTIWAALTSDDVNPGFGMTSTNGSAWTNRSVTGPPAGVLKNLSKVGAQFCAADNLSSNVFYTSTDGYTFANGGTLPYTTNWGASVANGANVVILTNGSGGNDDRTAYSTNSGATWTAGGVLPVASTWSDVIWTGRCNFAVDFNSPANAARSYDNGLTWTAVTMPAPVGIGNWGRPCATSQGTIFIPMFYNTGFTEHTILYGSTNDGDTWCLNTLSQNGQWGCAGSDGTRVVVCANNATGSPNTKGSYADPV